MRPCRAGRYRVLAKTDTSEQRGGTKRQIAVALSYQPESAVDAPKVVASGKGELARRILELAFTNGIKVREDADLAEVLAAVDVDSTIPVEAFMAVAEILAYVYRANRQRLPTPEDFPP